MIFSEIFFLFLCCYVWKIKRAPLVYTRGALNKTITSYVTITLMKIIKNKIPLSELKEMAAHYFGNLVKAVVDVDKKIMAVDGELHSDEEQLLLSEGSKQDSLWGINIYPDLKGKEMIEFDSMINIRPGQKNLSRGVADPEIRKKISEIVSMLIKM